MEDLVKSLYHAIERCSEGSQRVSLLVVLLCVPNMLFDLLCWKESNSSSAQHHSCAAVSLGSSFVECSFLLLLCNRPSCTHRSLLRCMPSRGRSKSQSLALAMALAIMASLFLSMARRDGKGTKRPFGSGCPA